MNAYYQAEKLKYRHTFLKALMIVMPLVSVWLAAWLTHSYFAVDSYNWWYIGLYPGLIGIVCGIIGGKDQKKKNVAIWPLPCSMEKIWDAKVLTGAAVCGTAVLCVMIFTILGGKVMEDIMQVTFILRPSVKTQLTAGVMIWLTMLWQIPFCLFLSQKMGMFLMLLVHIGSYMVSAAVISLKPWFVFVPGAITARLMCPVLGILPNGLPAEEGMAGYSPELMEMQALYIGIPAAVLWFLVFWLGSRRWFQRQVSI